MSVTVVNRRSEQFQDVCSQDFLQFRFGGRGYQDQLNDSIVKTQVLSAIKVEILTLSHELSGHATAAVTQDIMWVTHNFGFLGGSLGCAEGEKIARAFELAVDLNIPVCVQCRSGGARMQEGTSSLMQMAKVSVAVQALSEKRLPFISVLCDPTFGGVSASYAMQADVRIAVCQLSKARDGGRNSSSSTTTTTAAGSDEPRIGFAGPAVILNTMCESNQSRYDQQCPPDFQSASFVKDYGQIDMVLDNLKDGQSSLEEKVGLIAFLLTINTKEANGERKDLMIDIDDLTKKHMLSKLSEHTDNSSMKSIEPSSNESSVFNYTKSRLIDRPQTQDILHCLLAHFVELSGDGKVGRDNCLRGGVGVFDGVACVSLGTFKGHTPTDMQNANYGMPSPHGYRTAHRLMILAEKFRLPVITLVDTVGAWPTFECERMGQSEAIATNLTLMAGLSVPIVTVIVGEGGSGGALGICMGNFIGMLSGAYFGVISPEGAASILGRYKDEQHKLEQFPKDCQELATAQCIYAHQLQELGVVDTIIWEEDDNNRETYKHFPKLEARIRRFVFDSLLALLPLSISELVQQRYNKFRNIGTFSILDDAQRSRVIEDAKSAAAAASSSKGRIAPATTGSSTTILNSSLFIKKLAHEVVLGERSKFCGKAPSSMNAPLVMTKPLTKPVLKPLSKSPHAKNAKAILDEFGPMYLCQEWLPQQQNRVLLTDTTMRDAHQSLLATRVRTADLLIGAEIASELLKDAFSLECWGGATFDVCMRFLGECPWERLRKLRAACPNICLQMLIRGSNAVGYTSYADNVVQEFIRLAAMNGMDIFRIFDCFNDVDSMTVSIDAVLKSGKVAEVCICYTGNVLTSDIYHLDYYADVASKIKAAGAHILAVKDMAGLLRPLEVEPLMNALRRAVGASFPIHFHTHATSGGSIATCIEMARVGCNIIDFATASMADGTSQPSLNAFIAMMEGGSRDTGLNFMDLEPYDTFWADIRKIYSPFESGMLSGSARVFDHQIPGGQYSNLLVQCQSMGIQGEQWSAVLDAYRDVNHLFGDIVKVTPSSKCVGDLALYLVLKGLTTRNLIDPITNEVVPDAMLLDFPESLVSLMKGELGYPHLGFPSAVMSLILKGANIPPRSVRVGLSIPSVDFDENIAMLSKKFGVTITAEQAMSSLMYPKVFSDYMTCLQQEGPLRTLMPTQAYLYALSPGDIFSFRLPAVDLIHLVSNYQFPRVANASGDDGDGGGVVDEQLAHYYATIELLRVSSLQRQQRTVAFKIQIHKWTSIPSSIITIDSSSSSSSSSVMVHEETQQVQVRDTGGVFVFEGAMADPNLPLQQIASPMAGVIEKVFVKVGQSVTAGEVLCVVSAMKMEVKISVPVDAAVVSSIAIPHVGYRVVEGALLMSLK